jgi:hypothetical protein
MKPLRPPLSSTACAPPPPAPPARRAAPLLLALAIACLGLGCAARGERAIERMSPDQREFIAHGLTSFTPATTPADLDAAFGARPVESSSAHGAWHRAGAPSGEWIEAWFEDGRLLRLRISDRGTRVWSPGWTWELVAQGDRLVSLAPIPPIAQPRR